MASTLPSLKVMKTFGFKGGTAEFSNRYHFSGGTPADGAAWTAFSDAVVLIEKTIYSGRATIVKTIGYAGGSDVPVFSKTYSTPGTLGGAGVPVPGECVALGRWSTPARSTKNHPIYAYSYWHSVSRFSTGTNYDLLDSTQRTAMQTYAAGWVSGITAGGITAVRATAGGHTVNGSIVEEYITHRDFPPSTSV
jgi:hypothetical protein